MVILWSEINFQARLYLYAVLKCMMYLIPSFSIQSISVCTLYFPFTFFMLAPAKTCSENHGKAARYELKPTAMLHFCLLFCLLFQLWLIHIYFLSFDVLFNESISYYLFALSFIVFIPIMFIILFWYQKYIMFYVILDLWLHNFFNTLFQDSF